VTDAQCLSMKRLERRISRGLITRNHRQPHIRADKLERTSLQTHVTTTLNGMRNTSNHPTRLKHVNA